VIAVIADIHGNLWALEAVLRELDRMRPARVVVAGDLALGDPPHPHRLLPGARRPPPGEQRSLRTASPERERFVRRLQSGSF